MQDDNQDILIWADGFWCFRDEFHPNFLRDYNYRVVLRRSGEWEALSNARTSRAPPDANRADL